MNQTAPSAFDRFGTLTEGGTIVFERLLPGPIERVWDYIIDGEKRAKWFNGGDIPGVAGTDFTMIFNHTHLSGEVAPDRFKAMREPVEMTVKLLTIDPPYALSFTWPSEGYTGTVTISLSPAGDKVLLRLVHENPVIHRQSLLNYLGGWHTHLLILEDDLSDRKHSLFWTEFARIEAEYEMRFKA